MSTVSPTFFLHYPNLHDAPHATAFSDYVLVARVDTREAPLVGGEERSKLLDRCYRGEAIGRAVSSRAEGAQETIIFVCTK